MMVGRPVLLRVDKGEAHPGEVVLRVRGLQVLSDRGLSAVDDLSLDVRGGEILGIAGVQGNGQTELVEALSGLRMPVAGSIELLGRNVTRYTPRQLVDSGEAHIPEDRQKHGLVLSFPGWPTTWCCAPTSGPRLREASRSSGTPSRASRHDLRASSTFAHARCDRLPASFLGATSKR